MDDNRESLGRLPTVPEAARAARVSPLTRGHTRLETHQERKSQPREWRNTREKPGRKSAQMGKTCTRCGETKPAGEFPANRRMRDCLSSHCRSCHADSCARWRANHPEKIEARNTARREAYNAARRAPVSR